MKIQSKARATRGAQSLQHNYEDVPESLIRVGLYLPMDVHMRDLEWSEPTTPKTVVVAKRQRAATPPVRPKSRRRETPAPKKFVHPAAMNAEEYALWASEGKRRLATQSKKKSAPAVVTAPVSAYQKWVADGRPGAAVPVHPQKLSPEQTGQIRTEALRMFCAEHRGTSETPKAQSPSAWTNLSGALSQEAAR